MSQQNINVGAAPNDGTGDSLRAAFVKTESNFTELYSLVDATNDLITSVQTSLGDKADLVGGKVPSSQLPSYVDDVLEYTNLASFPVTGETGKIYVAIDSNLPYRWTGSTYVAISSTGIQSVNGQTGTSITLNTSHINDTANKRYQTDTQNANNDATSSIQTQLNSKEASTNKNASGGYVGLSLFKLQIKNALGTIVSLIGNANTAIRNYTLQDRDGILADDTDLASKENLTNKKTSLTTPNVTDYPSTKWVQDYVDAESALNITDCGTFDFSGNTFPTTGGTGAGGAIEKGNLFSAAFGGAPGGITLTAPYDTATARVNNPGQTLANWRIQSSSSPAVVSPIITVIASSTTPTAIISNNVAFTDILALTALAGNATFAVPTGTPSNGKKLIIRITDNGLARTLTFNSIFRFSSDLSAPTTTTVGKTLYLGFVYNSAAAKWDCIAKIDNL